jgi:sugar O-acyltransferase (sialic acid O-acetyltransferase NeuD family)
MKNVIIIGAGGHAAEIDEYIVFSRQRGEACELIVKGFLDDKPGNYSSYRFTAPYLGDIETHHIVKEQSYLIGIANLEHRRRIVERFAAEGAEFVSFIHPDAYVSPSADIGEGVIIGPYGNIGPNVRIGRFTLINSRASIGHDTVVGDYNFISPNVSLSGSTVVGDENMFGVNSATLPGIKVGSRNRIMAGMVLDRDVGDDSVVFHRFREKVIAKPKGGQ